MLFIILFILEVITSNVSKVNYTRSLISDTCETFPISNDTVQRILSY